MMNTSSLATTLLQELQQGQGLQQLGQQLGIDQNQTRQAVGAAIPLLLGAMGRTTSDPAGAQSLLGALQRDHANGPDLGSLLGAVLGGGGSAQTNGAGILGHIFGGDTPRAASGLGNATGLDSGRAGQLLALLAPIVMSFLARRFVGGAGGGNGGSTGGGDDASQLGQALQQERQNSGIGDILGSVLDQDGDGQFGASDLMKLGAGLFSKRS